MTNFKFNKGKKKSKKENTFGYINDIYKNENITLLQNDICKNIPDIFEETEAIMTVLPWSAGYNNFIENSIAHDTTYKDYLEGVQNVIKLKKPTFLIFNNQKFYERKFNPDYVIRQIEFTEYGKGNYCNIFVFNYKEKIDVKSTQELAEFLTKKFKKVLDFSCGYAEMIRYYSKKNDCKLLLSDIDFDCLSEIIEGEKLWKL